MTIYVFALITTLFNETLNSKETRRNCQWNLSQLCLSRNFTYNLFRHHLSSWDQNKLFVPS